ncbi:MFS transporter [Niallia taxi]|uniref:MFS transporter n=1 Tax=Niallia taxi TaxID=2499688 RepID=UPI003981A84C
MDTYQLISEEAKKKLLIILACSLVFSSMSATMFNVALPAITKELFLTSSQSSWIVTSYMIVYALGSVSYGKLADKYKLKNLITIGILLFSLGSLLGFLSSSFPLIIISRVMQAMGASVFPASAMIIPARYFSPETRGRALGMTSAGLSFGVAIGPIISGVLTTAFHWHYLFALCILPIVFIPLFRSTLDNQSGSDIKLDWVGAILLGGMVTLLLLGISSNQMFYFLFVILFVILLMWRIRKAKDPFIRGELFKNKKYTIILVLFALSSGIGFALPYLTPLFLSDVYHINAFTSGLIMFPGAALTALLSKRGGSLADKRGAAFLGYIAVTAYFVCFINLIWLVGKSPYFIMVILVFGYIAQSFFQMTLANMVSHVLPKAETGVGMGLFMLTNFIASSIATTLMGTSITRGTSFLSLNMFNLANQAAVYSDIYLMLTVIVVGMFCIFVFTVGKKTYSRNLKENV